MGAQPSFTANTSKSTTATQKVGAEANTMA